MEWGGCGELEEGAVGVDQDGEQADTGVGVLSYLNKLQGNSMLFDELYYKNFGDDYISSLKPSLIRLVFEATRIVRHQRHEASTVALVRSRLCCIACAHTMLALKLR
ncbi:hypothetical protein NDU88_005543 [Pleurodeles waltl]|uniref:Uncharacterized protein n=1 Tax=Pleurodeles waltl TaxID=8319 RepID=A0AAV7LSD7_PLEWA|nr:hypothetical protein NDU88_005543 [Pleurodeles waltl]